MSAQLTSSRNADATTNKLSNMSTMPRLLVSDSLRRGGCECGGWGWRGERGRAAIHVVHATKFHFQTSDNNKEGVVVACRRALATTVATSTSGINIISGRNWRRGVSLRKRRHMTTMRRFGISTGNKTETD